MRKTTPPVPTERFIVTEVEGFATSRAAGKESPMGLSCHVLDSAVGYRMMATFRSEQNNRTPMTVTTREARLAYARARVREMARARAAELNAGQLVAERQLQLSA